MPHKTPCYNKNMAGDGPPPIKSEEHMKKILTMAELITSMAPLLEPSTTTPMAIFVPKNDEMVTIAHSLLGHRLVVLSITHDMVTDSVQIQFEKPGSTPIVFDTEASMNEAKMTMEIWRSK